LQQLIVIGGGAAGFFTAINAALANPNLTVTILEKTNKLLSKVKVSGGGRCNVTHHCFEIPELSNNYPRGNRFLKNAFHHFNTVNTIEWFKQRGVQLHTEADGRMFPTTNNSQTIIDCFLKEAQKLNIKILTNQTVLDITQNQSLFTITTNTQSWEANYVCIATGGYQKLEQYQWLQKLNIQYNPTLPSLFTFNMPKHPITALMGVVNTNTTIKIKGTKWQQTGAVLITHWGLSGPATLKLSAFAATDLHNNNYQFDVVINWIPQYNETNLANQWNQLISNTNKTCGNHNPFNLPNRLWHFLLEQAQIDLQQKWQNIPKDKTNKLIKLLTAMEMQVNGKTTFKEEFVTCGGVALQQIDFNTMQHKTIPNLFFAGETLDIDGITGGFNFQNAWTTGFIAAKSIAALSV
jgi:predicted Rossmann fold flavoprotein